MASRLPAFDQKSNKDIKKSLYDAPMASRPISFTHISSLNSDA
jgi:hypothetical protein